MKIEKDSLYLVKLTTNDTVVAYLEEGEFDTVTFIKPVYMYLSDTGNKEAKTKEERYEIVISAWLPIQKISTDRVEVDKRHILYYLPVNLEYGDAVAKYTDTLYVDKDKAEGSMKEAMSEVASWLEKFKAKGKNEGE